MHHHSTPSVYAYSIVFRCAYLKSQSRVSGGPLKGLAILRQPFLFYLTAKTVFMLGVSILSGCHDLSTSSCEQLGASILSSCIAVLCAAVNYIRSLFSSVNWAKQGESFGQVIHTLKSAKETAKQTSSFGEIIVVEKSFLEFHFFSGYKHCHSYM